MFRRQPTAKPVRTLPTKTPFVKTQTVPTQKARLVRNLDSLSDAHFAVILRLQVDKDGNVIAKRPVEFMWKHRIFRLTKVALRVSVDHSEKWILSLYDPETKVVDDIVREAPASSALDHAREVFLRQATITQRRQLVS